MTLPRIIIVSGTDTGVGKTIATAALSSALTQAGRVVAVYKPCQTGSAEGDDDAGEVLRLAGPAQVMAGTVLRAPLAPVVAARLEGAHLPEVATHAERVSNLAAGADHVIIEGSGGLLVELDFSGHTIADLARLTDGSCIVVVRAALGTLNHTALTLEAAARRNVDVLGLVIGSWPASPGDAETHNRHAFEGSSTAPLLGAIPEGAGKLAPPEFRAGSGQWLPGVVP